MARKPLPDTIGATQFRIQCLRIIDELEASGQVVTITKRGQPVATLHPVARDKAPKLFGAMAGSVVKYDDPFSPAVEAEAWDVLNPAV